MGSKHRLEAVSQLLGQSVDDSVKVAALFPYKMTPFLVQRLEEGSYSIQAARQYLPDARELFDLPSAGFDPCNEGVFKVTDHIIQRYDNRAALIVTQHCIVYCRFCFRRDFVGFKANQVSEEALDLGIRYLEENPANRDILMTGGDPLALPNRQLIPIIERLSAIPHLQVIRIHTRALSAQPGRLDADLLAAFRSSGKIWFYTHMNHPDDLDHPEVRLAADKIRETGTPILNQAVLLSGVNDDPVVMKELCLRCYEAKIIPYHLYVLDQVPGTAHFQVDVDRQLEIFDSLADLPGPAQPVFVIIDRSNLKQRAVPGRAIDRESLRTMLTAKTTHEPPISEIV